MSGKKLITVLGATGLQGGAVVNAFLNDMKLKDEWIVRGVTRDTSKDPARKLETKGVEVVAADLNDRESLKKAMAGSYAVFAVTNYWEKMDMQLEIQQGKNSADAAKAAGVQLYIWSTVDNVTKLSNGVLSKTYHFDSKAAVEEYVRELGIPATFFMPGFYMSNFTAFGMLRQMPPDNSWALALPISSKAIIPVFDTNDTGLFVKAAVMNRDKVLGRRILGASAYMTGDEVVETFKKCFPEAGKTAHFVKLSEESFRRDWRGMGVPEHAVEGMYENMVLLDTFGYYGGESLDWTDSLLEDKLTALEEYFKKTLQFADLK